MTRKAKDSESSTRLLSEQEDKLPATSGLQAGERVGTHTIVDRIASGGFGSVYKAKRDDGMVCALKILHADKINQEVVERFHREVRVMQKLDHPNVVKFYELGVHDDGRPFLTMELLEGESLRDRLRSGRITPQEALNYLEPLCGALDTAHQQNIIHRDLKTSNVFLARLPAGGERLVLLDFGVAKLHDDDTVSLTTSRHMVGTPTTMAPEQIGRGTVGPRTDIYGLGILVFRMLTGRNPFQETSALLLQHLHLTAKPPSPSQFVPIPRKLDDVVLKALEKDQEDRQSSVMQFLQEYKDAIGSEQSNPSASREKALQGTTAALAIYIEVVADPAALEDPDDALLEDMDSVLNIGREYLTSAAYRELIETGNSILLVHSIPSEDKVAELTEKVQGLVEALENRETKHEGVHFKVCLNACEDVMVGDQVVNQGEVTALTGWTHDVPLDGVVSNEATASKLRAETEAISAIPGLFRLKLR